ncbi:MAG TPA: FkbM family methyltransferase [Chitinophagaceae bacterium]|nr:FkbM family methyltransferase [Chitinophagaceae bacterium]
MKNLLKNYFKKILQKRGIEINRKERLKFVGKEILVSKGAFLREYAEDNNWLYALSRNNKNILDIGCNIGQSSLLLMINTNNRIACVDPNPKALSRCAENLIFNNLSDHATFHNYFIGDADNVKIKFYSSFTDSSSSMFKTFIKKVASVVESFEVNQIKADTLCEMINFAPDLIKVDVEGAETKVLQGINNILKKKPLIFVEVHSGIELSIVDNTNNIMNWCQLNYYTPYYMKSNEVLKSTEEIKNIWNYYLLLVANGQRYPEYLRELSQM